MKVTANFENKFQRNVWHQLVLADNVDRKQAYAAINAFEAKLVERGWRWMNEDSCFTKGINRNTRIEFAIYI